MKKLISMADMEQLLTEQKKECVVATDTIITPAAIDFAEEKGIRLIEQPEMSNQIIAQLDSDEAVNSILQLLGNKDILQALITSLKDDPYEAHQDESGVKIIYGKTVRMSSSQKDNKQLCGQVLVKKDTLEAGLLAIQDTDFCIKTKSEEVNLVLEGELIVKINEKAYKAEKGDIVSIPAGIQLERSAIGTAKIFYVRS
ncbi:hypothetical protein [uncultured Enterococcus sp.]|uniref:hypothetical protein n=1 Tax=uncultured Enterococcus sp. TaxID=167972 RepID=UPI002AA8109C|nr:hypothetical protein [uncultured Enterococcus sp.]